MSGIQNSNNLACPHEEVKGRVKEKKRGRGVKTNRSDSKEMHNFTEEPSEVRVTCVLWRDPSIFLAWRAVLRCPSDTQWTLSGCHFISPSLIHCPSLVPFKTRWRDDQEAASVKTSNQYSSSVREEAPRLQWKSQMANDSFKLLSWLWTVEFNQSR